MYKEAFEIHGDSPSSVLWPKGRQNLRFEALTKFINKKSDFSVLDFGCGLAHLKEFLNDNYSTVSYTGVDMLPEFIDANKKKYPQSDFLMLNDVNEIKSNYDFICVSGTFNILYEKDFKTHQTKVFDIVKTLFQKCNVYLSVNFMTDAVDFQQPDTYHQNVTELYEFAIKNLSKRLVIDQSYMPYEYTLTVWKNENILRPDNIYSLESE